MYAVKLKVMVDQSHKLNIELPADAPHGEAEVIVLMAGESTSPNREDSLDAFFKELDGIPRPVLSKAEIDRYLADERSSWE